MRYTTLINTDELAETSVSPSLVVVDCRFDLKDTSSGARAYAASHVPGAVYAHLDRDLSGEKTGTNGRHPLPDPAALALTLGRLGIDRNTQVVAYDQDSGSYASRLWWMLRWLGHDAAAVLNGGFAKWVAEDRPTVPGVETHAPRRFVPDLRPDMVAIAGDVEAVVRNAAAHVSRLIDARAPERFRGEIEPVDPTPGHIPGALNLPYLENLDEQGTIRPAADLAARFRAALGDTPPDRVIAYCGSGVTACENLLALEYAGMPGAKLYAGSWSEWSADPSRPIERSE